MRQGTPVALGRLFELAELLVALADVEPGQSSVRELQVRGAQVRVSRSGHIACLESQLSGGEPGLGIDRVDLGGQLLHQLQRGSAVAEKNVRADRRLHGGKVVVGRDYLGVLVVSDQLRSYAQPLVHVRAQQVAIAGEEGQESHGAVPAASHQRRMEIIDLGQRDVSGEYPLSFCPPERDGAGFPAAGRVDRGVDRGDHPAAGVPRVVPELGIEPAKMRVEFRRVPGRVHLLGEEPAGHRVCALGAGYRRFRSGQHVPGRHLEADCRHQAG